MCHWWPLPVLLMFLRKYNHTKWREGGVVCGQGNGGGGGGVPFDTCCSILERGAQAKLAAQMANVYNGIESCPA